MTLSLPATAVDPPTNGRAEADPITTEVVRNFMTACAEDMNAALFRSAFSPVIYEGRDCAVALLDHKGDMLGQSTGVPIFIGNLELCVKVVLEQRGPQSLEPGDILAMNDSYIQGSHLHDMTVLGPIFHRGRLVGFAANRAHWLDTGAIDPGTTMGSTEIYHEGLRLGPTKIGSAYAISDEWIDVLSRNSRFPEALVGDLNAQIASVRTGERRFGRLLDRIGYETFESAKENIFAQCDELDRAAIAAIPDGTYRAEGSMDDDGAGSGPVPVKVAMTIDGERMAVDLAGTSGPVRGPMNCGAAQAVSMVRLAYRTQINPHLPITGGSFPTLDIRIPESCLLNAREPAACEWYFSPLGLLADLMINCLGQAVDGFATGAHYGDSMVTCFTGQDLADNLYTAVEPTAGGWGAWEGSDGESGLINLSNGAFKNIPVEVYETKYPIRITEFSLRTDSGGPGRWRGGTGVVRSYEPMIPAGLSLWYERSVTPAWGVKGGRAGAPPVIGCAGEGIEFNSLKTPVVEMPPGARVVTQTGGGGGYGDPFERDPAAVLADVLDGYVSVEGAERDYGAVISGRRLDEAATEALRSARAGDRAEP